MSSDSILWPNCHTFPKDPYRFPVIASNGLVYDLNTGTPPYDLIRRKGAGLIPGFDSITSPAVLLTTGDNAIVDWVLWSCETRTMPKVISTRSALLQRDGDIVDLDGLVPLTFPNTPYAAYYVAVKHRNHLGVMTASPISFQNLSSVIDFTLTSTPTFDFASPRITITQVWHKKTSLSFPAIPVYMPATLMPMG